MYKHLHIFKICVRSIKEWVWWTICNREHVRLQQKARTWHSPAAWIIMSPNGEQ